MTRKPFGNEEDYQRDITHDIGDYTLWKSRLVARQCDTCIFRRDNPIMSPERLVKYAAAVLEDQRFIPCHSTYGELRLAPNVRPAMCRGFYTRHRTESVAIKLIEKLWGFVEVDIYAESKPTIVPPWLPWTDSDILRMYVDEKLAAHVIEERTGVPRYDIKKILNAAGVAMRSRGRRPGRHDTPELIKAVGALRAQGKSIKAIAAEVGKSFGTVQRICQELKSASTKD